ncbi:hypothetical protein BCT07_08710 [Vibrio breoganii]|uniref:hypothetical protein n=1 Tax=Vibrio breoganii TaxID=553239 RepID=UPI000C82F2CF|nr:hypothetical protein [Vibrio breoganii]PMO59846.1 hypothetical protein BCT07_08710 [Vibrio breoganii]
MDNKTKHEEIEKIISEALSEIDKFLKNNPDKNDQFKSVKKLMDLRSCGAIDTGVDTCEFGGFWTH